jgi:hypothetical protein
MPDASITCGRSFKELLKENKPRSLLDVKQKQRITQRSSRYSSNSDSFLPSHTPADQERHKSVVRTVAMQQSSHHPSPVTRPYWLPVILQQCTKKQAHNFFLFPNLHTQSRTCARSVRLPEFRTHARNMNMCACTTSVHVRLYNFREYARNLTRASDSSASTRYGNADGIR